MPQVSIVVVMLWRARSLCVNSALCPVLLNIHVAFVAVAHYHVRGIAVCPISSSQKSVHQVMDSRIASFIVVGRQRRFG